MVSSETSYGRFQKKSISEISEHEGRYFNLTRTVTATKEGLFYCLGSTYQDDIKYSSELLHMLKSMEECEQWVKVQWAAVHLLYQASYSTAVTTFITRCRNHLGSSVKE